MENPVIFYTWKFNWKQQEHGQIQLKPVQNEPFIIKKYVYFHLFSTLFHWTSHCIQSILQQKFKLSGANAVLINKFCMRKSKLYRISSAASDLDEYILEIQLLLLLWHKVINQSSTYVFGVFQSINIIFFCLFVFKGWWHLVAFIDHYTYLYEIVRHQLRYTISLIQI